LECGRGGGRFTHVPNKYERTSTNPDQFRTGGTTGPYAFVNCANAWGFRGRASGFRDSIGNTRDSLKENSVNATKAKHGAVDGARAQANAFAKAVRC